MNRYRLGVTAFVGWLTVGGALAAPPPERQFSDTKGGRSDTIQVLDFKEITSALSAIKDQLMALVEAVARSNPTEAEAEQQSVRSQQDLLAQQDMAWWAMWMFIAAMVQAALSLFGVVLLIRNLRLVQVANQATLKAVAAAERGNEISDRTAKQQLRAYVSVDKVDVAVVGVARPIFQIVLSNRGQTPATKVVGKLQAFPKALPLAQSLAFGSNVETRQLGVIGPSGSFQMRLTGATPLDAGLLGPIAERKMAIFIVGLIDYEDVFGGTWHTKFTVVFDDSTLNDPTQQLPAWIDGNEAT